MSKKQAKGTTLWASAKNKEQGEEMRRGNGNACIQFQTILTAGDSFSSHPSPFSLTLSLLLPNFCSLQERFFSIFESLLQTRTQASWSLMQFWPWRLVKSVYPGPAKTKWRLLVWFLCFLLLEQRRNQTDWTSNRGLDYWKLSCNSLTEVTRLLIPLQAEMERQHHLSDQLRNWALDEMRFRPQGRHVNTTLPTKEDFKM